MGWQVAWPSPDWEGDKASSVFSAFREEGQSDAGVASGPAFLQSTVPAMTVYDSIAFLLKADNLNANSLCLQPNSHFLSCSCHIP